MGKIAFVFAGQGAQYSGMGQSLCEAEPRRPGRVRRGGHAPPRHQRSSALPLPWRSFPSPRTPSPACTAWTWPRPRPWRRPACARTGGGLLPGGDRRPELCRGVHAGGGLRLCVQAGPGHAEGRGGEPRGHGRGAQALQRTGGGSCAPALRRCGPSTTTAPASWCAPGRRPRSRPSARRWRRPAAGPRCWRSAAGSTPPLWRAPARSWRQVLAGVELRQPRGAGVRQLQRPALHGGSAKELLVNQVKNPVRWQETVERLCGAGRGHLHRVRPGQDPVRAHPQDGKGRHGAERAGRRDPAGRGGGRKGPGLTPSLSSGNSPPAAEGGRLWAGKPPGGDGPYRFLKKRSRPLLWRTGGHET